MNEEHEIWEEDQCDLLQRQKGGYKTKLSGKKVIWKNKWKAKLKNNLSIIWAWWNLQGELANLICWKKPRVTRSDSKNRGSISHKTLFGRQCKQLEDKEKKCSKIKAVIWHKVRNEKNERNMWTWETKPLWYSVITNSCVEACDKPLKSNVKSIFLLFLMLLKMPRCYSKNNILKHVNQQKVNRLI